MAKTMLEQAKAKVLGRAGIDGEALQAACRTINFAMDGTGVKLTVGETSERLDPGECVRLIEFGRRLREVPAGASAEAFPGSGPTFAEREAARELEA